MFLRLLRRSRVLVCVCLLFSALLWAGASRGEPPATGKVQAYTCRLWYCVSDSRGVGALYLNGDVQWDEAKGVLTLGLEPSKQLLWVPGPPRPGRPTSNPLREIGELDVELQREQKGLWRIASTEHAAAREPTSEKDSAELAVGFGRVFHLALAAQSRAHISTFDRRTLVVAPDKEAVVKTSPFSEQRSAPVRNGERVVSELSLVRESGSSVDAFVVRADGVRILAGLATIWAGGVDAEPETQATVTSETVGKLRDLLALAESADGLQDKALKRFLSALQESHPGNKVKFTLVELDAPTNISVEEAETADEAGRPRVPAKGN